jgi:hypothetical protein
VVIKFALEQLGFPQTITFLTIVTAHTGISEDKIHTPEASLGANKLSTPMMQSNYYYYSCM